MALKEFTNALRRGITASGHSQSNSIDSRLKWSPLAYLFLLDMAGVYMKHTDRQHLLIASVSEALASAFVEPLKKVVKRKRPFPSQRHNSFPSGHTAASFAGAEIVHQELKDTNPVLSYSSYILATATAIRRLYDHKHFLSDVVTGAAIGILSTHLSYWLLFNKEEQQ